MAAAVGGGNEDEDGGEVSLREWLERPERSVVEMVSLVHSQGVTIGNVRLSLHHRPCYIMSTFIESASCLSSGSDSCRNGGGSEDKDDDDDDDDGGSGSGRSDPCSTSPSRPAETSREGGYEQTSDTSCLRSCSAHGEGTGRRKEDDNSGKEGRELFCPTRSFDEKLRTMSNLRHRVLPAPLLPKWPKGSFLPPVAVLQSEFLNEPRDSLEEREAAIKLREEIEDQQLLLEFLLRLQQCKQETADKLHDIVFCLSSDMEEILKQLEIHEDHFAVEKDDSVNSGSRQRVLSRVRTYYEDKRSEPLSDSLRSELQQKNQETISSTSCRLMKNFKKLEAAYFSTRCRMTKPGSRHESRIVATAGSGPAVSLVDNLLPYKEVLSETRQREWISPFLEGLRKYLFFSKLRMRADLRQGDLLNSSNLVCSLGFDRDRELFAPAGVNRKIKIFECDVVLNEDRDMHYPLVEMVSRSKLSSICWKGYIKSQIASRDFEGVWDVTRSQVFLERREHERRMWSIDFSLTDPTKLASGSDDGTVKLWNINQNGSTGTIKTKANVHSVQFPPDSAWSLAVGPANYRIYLYDLRSARAPLCILVGHAKTVSYVKFVDSSTLVSASTDNSLKLWDLSAASSRVLESPHFLRGLIQLFPIWNISSQLSPSVPLSPPLLYLSTCRTNPLTFSVDILSTTIYHSARTWFEVLSRSGIHSIFVTAVASEPA
ncbi:unnamed protein product [Spirodela intermedia]|uniref:Uncharacterized protein n=1 Tax=Spirodela intermedia TaxID=51605 RepID=A0A7I8ISB8_SPIIN|nr:unnamed protein product [Spirodela intermedia]CAA6660888.1 unnamed protein product [Spirodela intermedia]